MVRSMGFRVEEVVTTMAPLTLNMDVFFKSEWREHLMDTSSGSALRNNQNNLLGPPKCTMWPFYMGAV